MTFYEHAMLGATLALAAGLQSRHGWGIVAMAAVAAVLPDWDGLTIVFGATAYDRSHRIWGHNLMTAGMLGALTGAAEYFCNLIGRLGRVIGGLLTSPASGSAVVPAEPIPFSFCDCAVWGLVGSLASLSHLAVDLIYSGHPRMSDWPLRLFWPFSDRGWAYPVVPWGDVGATMIFIAEMFALSRWRSRASRIGLLALAALAVYIAVRLAVR
ncbi:MAG: metal-dependent hydrolase [Planctomycetes bacterium]|nr:metal-dependent hydrolase [Planctomycetota bacterium]